MASKIDWQFLRRPLIVFVISAVLTAVFIVAGLEFESQKQDRYNQSRSSLQKSHARYDQLVKDLDLLQQYTLTYERYKNTGLLGGERRLSWIETLEKVNEELRLPTMEYALQPQENYSAPKFKPDRSLIVLSTPMDLKMDLLHEGDLLEVFSGIDKSISNLYTIDQCRIGRKVVSGGTLNTKKANFSSNCRLRWITVDVKQS